MRDFKKVDIWDYMELEIQALIRCLEDVIIGYAEKTNEERVDEVHRAFDAIRKHLDKQESVLESLVDDEALSSVFQDFKFCKQQIMELLDDMFFEHVDESTFLIDMIRLNHLLNRLSGLESESLFSRLRESMSDEARDAAERFLVTY
ncbi:MAG: hypothetical protein K2Z81_10930 [Cyanobacteria bacterium]|nr:hypothetical protein [Cyanobacteriota bacterium]